MGHQSGHLVRQWRYILSKRVAGFVIACALLSLLWINAGSEGQLRKTFDSMSQQVAQSTASAASLLAGDKRPKLDVQLHNVTTPLVNGSSPAPFPTLPPPDNEEYMAICMAG